MKYALAIWLVLGVSLYLIQPTWTPLGPEASDPSNAAATAQAEAFESGAAWWLFASAHATGPVMELQRLRRPSYDSRYASPAARVARVNNAAQGMASQFWVRSLLLFVGASLGLLGAFGFARGFSKNPMLLILFCAAAGGFGPGSALALIVSIPVALALLVCGLVASPRD